MQRQYSPSLRNQPHPGGMYATTPESPVSSNSTTTTQRTNSESNSTSTPHHASNGLKISNLVYPSTSQGKQLVIGGVYPKSYDHSQSAPPSGRSGLLMGAHQNDSMSDISNTAGAHMVSAIPQQSHKRAYRQRRKDPSCDACRERKVKCDASDSSSCTECSNRNVRCLFTKETNRRMSSIKQVQDLERQLAQAKLQLKQLRSNIPKIDSLMDPDYAINDDVPKIPEIGHRPERLKTPNVNYDYSHVCSKMRSYAQGLIDFPQTPSFLRPRPTLTKDVPPLPPINVTHALLGQYFSCLHHTFPIVHWPTFLSDYERIQKTGNLRGVSRGWASVFFALLGCGSLHSVDASLISKGREYMQLSADLLDLWQDKYSIDEVRATVLISRFLYEINLKSASWVWLGSGVRMAQDIGLHVESGAWTPMDNEMRRRVWWSLYAWERFVPTLYSNLFVRNVTVLTATRLCVLEIGRPLMIQDDDCDIDLPSPTEEHLLPASGPVSAEQQSNPLLVIIHIMRCVSQLSKSLKGSVLSSNTLEIFDRHFRMCLRTFPPDYQMQSSQYLDPRSLYPVIFLQNTRLVLHRHNISPACSPEMRHLAINQCLAVAHDTTRLLTRCMRSPNSMEVGSPSNTGEGDWRYLLAVAANTVLCTHIWRCILLLLFREEYEAALVCIQASSAIGDARSINISSGRYVSFFLKLLLDKQKRGDTISPERDEELMAYVSGDLQNGNNGSWVWRNSESKPFDSNSPRMAHHPSSNASPLKAESMDGARIGPDKPEEQIVEWEGWAWIERMTQMLLSEQQKQQQQPQLQPRPQQKPVAVSGTTIHKSDVSNARALEPFKHPPETTTNTDNRSASSKMTIASII